MSWPETEIMPYERCSICHSAAMEGLVGFKINKTKSENPDPPRLRPVLVRQCNQFWIWKLGLNKALKYMKRSAPV